MVVAEKTRCSIKASVRVHSAWLRRYPSFPGPCAVGNLSAHLGLPKISKKVSRKIRIGNFHGVARAKAQPCRGDRALDKYAKVGKLNARSEGLRAQAEKSILGTR
jgi:hypothetical protein